MENIWKIKLRIYRQKGQGKPYFDEFNLDVNPDEYILDAIERVWAFHDRSLCFAHACHHSTCGACGMRINDQEKLTCITPIRTVAKNGSVVKVEPLRNFPIISDLVVDLGSLFRTNAATGQRQIISEEIEPAFDNWNQVRQDNARNYFRLSDCIECGCCVSACPSAATDPEYVGPAGLAGAHQHGYTNDPELRRLIDSPNGVWRCHSAYECTAVCPSNVDPAGRIMSLRRQIMIDRIKGLFRG